MHTTPSFNCARTLFNSLLYFRCFRFGFRIPFGFQTSGSRSPLQVATLRPRTSAFLSATASGTGPVILPFAGRKELQRYSAPINTVQIYKKSAERQTAAPPNCQQSARRSFSRTPAGNNPARIAHGTSMNRPGLILRSSRGYGTTAGASPATPDLSRQ